MAKMLTRREMLKLTGSAVITLALASACRGEDSEAGSTGVLLRGEVGLAGPVPASRCPYPRS